ncbi:MAG TPA: helix-turn-helix domain-containing protein [Pyrinomonadaceae bacterium]|jgi:Transcriptional regulator containing PAS, AAA-type ATPase, and DNA-binding domains
MSSALSWEPERDTTPREDHAQTPEVAVHNLLNIRDAAMTLLKELDSLTKGQQGRPNRRLDLHEEVQRYEIDLIRGALKRTRGNQRRAAKLLGVKVSTLNCKIKRFGISLTEHEVMM